MTRAILLFALAGCQTLMPVTDMGANPEGRGLFDQDTAEARSLAEQLAYSHVTTSQARTLEGILDLYTDKVQIQGGRAHVRLDQTVDGIPVWGAQAVVHIDGDGEVTGLTDRWTHGVSVDTNPELGPDAAIDLAERGNEGMTAPPVADLFVMRHQGEDHLVWRVQMTRMDGSEHTAKPVAFVDAHTGQVLWRYNNLQTTTTAYATTSYNGSISFPVEVEGGRYVLRSDADGVGTYTFNNDQPYYISAGVLDSVSSSSTSWKGDKVAADAHYAAVQTVSYYAAMHNRDGVSGSGGPNLKDGVMVSGVHYGRNYANAFWDGKAMVYGDGDGYSLGSVTALDVGAHEMTHGVTQYTAALVYQGESGALNESMSDVFAALVEQYVEGSGAHVWDIGEDVYTPGTSGDALRYMGNPTLDGQSKDHYSTRYTGYSDNGGVHLNSGIGNLAFYLVVEGGQHPKSYHRRSVVNGIGFDKAGAIWYKALTEYMTPNTNFHEARQALIEAAGVLYGQGSAEQVAVAGAWAEVGVGDPMESTGGTTPPTDPGTGGAASDALDLSGLSGGAGDMSDYVVSVPQGATELVVVMSGGTGDADLYVNAGKAGTDSAFACRPYRQGNEETCTISNPGAGDWHVTVRGYSAYSGVSLAASVTAPAASASADLDEVISGAKGDKLDFTLEVPAGSGKLTVQMSGGTGDADLYVRQAGQPTMSTYDCRPWVGGNTEVCTFDAPAAGTWYVMVDGYAAFSGVSLTSAVR